MNLDTHRLLRLWYSICTLSSFPPSLPPSLPPSDYCRKGADFVHRPRRRLGILAHFVLDRECDEVRIFMLIAEVFASIYVIVCLFIHFSFLIDWLVDFHSLMQSFIRSFVVTR